MEMLCTNVANGESLISIAKKIDLPYGWIYNWVRKDQDRNKQYLESLQARNEWMKQTVLDELKALGTSDVRKLYDDKGALLPPNQWPDEMAKSISSVESAEIFEYEGPTKVHVGDTKKVKLWDKNRSLELIGKSMALFTEKHEVAGKVTLEDLLTASAQGEASAKEDKAKEEEEDPDQLD